MSKRNVTGATLSPDPSRDHVSSKANEVDVKAVPVTASVTPAPERSSRAESSSKDPSNKAKIKRIERKIHKVMLHEACTREAAESLVRGAHEDKVKRLEEVHVLENLLQEDAGAKHRIEVRMVRTSLDEDSVKEKAFHQTILPLEHAVYSRYQMDIHKDEPEECTVKQYSRFLCDTPILFTPFPNGQFVAGIPGFGSYHMQYWLDGVRLMAVGVIDILPTGLSSVYLFYDPEFSFLGLGTYSALRELALVRQLMQQFLPCRYYYMGFYIHSCCKMRYKGKFLPSDLLCPEVRTWHPIQQAMKLLDVNKYSRLNPDETVVDEESRGICDQAIGVVIAGHGTSNYFRYQDLKSEDPDLPTTEQKVREYASLVGRKAVKSLLLYLE